MCVCNFFSFFPVFLLSFRVSKGCPRLLINMEKAGQVILRPPTASFLSVIDVFLGLSVQRRFCFSACRPILCLGWLVSGAGWTLTPTRRTGDPETLLVFLSFCCNLHPRADIRKKNRDDNVFKYCSTDPKCSLDLQHAVSFFTTRGCQRFVYDDHWVRYFVSASLHFCCTHLLA